MSHYVVLVAGDDHEKQLEPYWELDLSQEEMAKDPRAVFNDCTDEVMQSWETGTIEEWHPELYLDKHDIARVDFMADDTIRIETTEHPLHNYKISRLENNERIVFDFEKDRKQYYGALISIEEIKDGLYRLFLRPIDDPKRISFKEKYGTLEKFVEEYHCYHQVDGKYGYYSNPNAKWDWYSVGGRWRNYLKLKPQPIDPKEKALICNGFEIKKIETLADMAEINPKGFQNMINMHGEKAVELLKTVLGYIKARYPQEHATGDLSVFASMALEKGEVTETDLMLEGVGHCDVTHKGAIDVEGMEAPKRIEAENAWDEFHLKRPNLNGKSYADFMKDVPKPSTETPFRNAYERFPDEMKKWGNENLGFMGGYNAFEQIARMDKEEYVACASSWTPYALLWNGTWYARGDMGWWGMDSNREPQWNGTFKQLWAEIPDDTLITTVDCHI